MAHKSAIRKLITQQLNEIPCSDKSQRDKVLFDYINNWIGQYDFDQVCAYYPIKNEVNINWGELGYPMYLPRRINDKNIDFHKCTLNECKKDPSSQLYEPDSSFPQVNKSKMTLMLIPALAFNQEGYRLGYGGGYFDRLIDSWDTKYLVTLGVGYYEQLLKWKHDEHDKKLNHIFLADKSCAIKCFDIYHSGQVPGTSA